MASALALALGGSSAAADDLPPGHAAVPAQRRPPARVAQVAQVAVDPDPFVVSAGVRAGGGVIFAEGLSVGVGSGGFGHAGFDVTLAPRGPGSGPIFGLTEQLEIWSAPGAGGVALPGVLFGGYRLLPLVVTVGVGLNVFTVDWQDGKKNGVGIYSPRAAARLGLQLGRVSVMAEAEVQRRWRTELADITMGQLGLTVGFVVDPQMAGPPRGAR